MRAWNDIVMEREDMGRVEPPEEREGISTVKCCICGEKIRGKYAYIPEDSTEVYCKDCFLDEFSVQISFLEAHRW